MVSEPTSAPDAATEETFHLMTDIGFAGVYPAEFWPAFETDFPEKVFMFFTGAGGSASQVYQCYVSQQEGEGLEGASILTSAMGHRSGWLLCRNSRAVSSRGVVYPLRRVRLLLLSCRISALGRNHPRRNDGGPSNRNCKKQ